MWLWDRLTKQKKQEELEKKQAPPTAEVRRGEGVEVEAEHKDDHAHEKSTALLDTAARALHIIEHPHSTEKTVAAEKGGTYTFVINPKASKGQVREALKDLYGVHAQRVRIAHLPGKSVRFGRFSGSRSARAHALVTLKKGETLSLTPHA